MGSVTPLMYNNVTIPLLSVVPSFFFVVCSYLLCSTCFCMFLFKAHSWYWHLVSDCGCIFLLLSCPEHQLILTPSSDPSDEDRSLCRNISGMSTETKKLCLITKKT
ncbi:hypothetical protein XENOCAPTIV_009205 [Xenoophorus captivus]|uniref:Uncharacterized protein n=1 Tax=Xenoophorus captivus TaxID=1517983 RepID=A0ABV0Q8Y7_9TELE